MSFGIIVLFWNILVLEDLIFVLKHSVFVFGRLNFCFWKTQFLFCGGNVWFWKTCFWKILETVLTYDLTTYTCGLISGLPEIETLSQYHKPDSQA